MKDKCENESGYPDEVAQKNIEVLASKSMELFDLLIDMFFNSSLEKRAYLKVFLFGYNYLNLSLSLFTCILISILILERISRYYCKS